MKILKLVVILLVCLLSTPAIADFYQWEDERGVIHVADDLLLVPPKYRDKVKVYKTLPPPPESPPPPSEPPPTPAEGEELYGDYPLEWWRNEFERRKQAISELEKEITAKKRYVEVFEGGRRFGQTYSQEDVRTYEDYKRQLPSLEERLGGLKRDLEEFRRKATASGVPREVRE
ncbi:MAG: DUF4124 domain-containing protein [Deltaproteobacteria bacterium]|nr:DUF4124 domain-containing protein [Deltaproteobacteria bacterium]